jgi:feruloyl esterase
MQARALHPWPLALVLAGLALAGCASRPATVSTAALPAQACAALATLKLPDTVIHSAVPSAASANAAAGQPAAAHCLVRGTLESRTGVGEGGAPRPYGSGFELRLPAQWNGRFFFQGGGGTDGVIRPAIGLAGSTPGQTPALDKGYAVVSTDAGHQGADASFGLDAQARVDWAYRSVDIVATTAKQIIATYYGSPARYSYFLGCSNGGRQGMMATQRYPAQFDGVVAGNPGYRLPMSSAAGLARSREFRKVAPPGADGKPDLTQAFSKQELGVLGRRVLAACDAQDGAADGLVENYKACKFDIATAQCAPGRTGDCLSADKVNALRFHFNAGTTKAGRAVSPGFPYDPGVAEPGWAMWTLGQSSVARANAGKPGPLQYLFITPPEAGFDVSAADLDRDLHRFVISDALMSADSTDLSGFRLRGGKLIVYHGIADPVFSSLDTQRWFDNLVRAQGGPQDTATFARLFLVPGMNHCSGGAALDSFDALAPIVDWVEKGIAPAAIAATGKAFPGRTRGLCPYPAYARYKGQGSVDDAANFSCVMD